MEKTIKERWQKLDAKRAHKLLRAKECSLITIPTLLPPAGHTQDLRQYQTYSSIQARGVTSLASKILSVLIPLNDTPFFSFGLKNSREPPQEISEYLTLLASQVYKKMISKNLREVAYLAIQHLVVVGDVLVMMEDDFSFRVISLDNYVTRRDVNGDLLELIYLEYVASPNDEDCNHYAFTSDQDNQPGYQTVYIRCSLEDKNWRVEKEVDGTSIDEGYYEEAPFTVLRWSNIAGEDYGRSHVEDIYSDIVSLEKFTKSLIQGLLAGSTFFMGVDPSGITELDDISGASNGSWVAARKQDIFTVSPSETLNPQIGLSSQAVDNMRKEVGAGFLLQTAVMPTGDRVTATAIRAIGSELETVLGGTFSAISRDLFVPMIRRVIFRMLQEKTIDDRMTNQFDSEFGILDIEILTGLQSLNRESDLTRLMQMGEMLRNLPPNALSSFKWEAYARALITSLGFDPLNWVKSEEENKQEAAAAQQQAQQMEFQKMAAQGAINTATQAAGSDIENTGGANVDAALQQAGVNPQQVMQMLGMGGQAPGMGGAGGGQLPMEGMPQ